VPLAAVLKRVEAPELSLSGETTSWKTQNPPHQQLSLENSGYQALLIGLCGGKTKTRASTEPQRIESFGIAARGTRPAQARSGRTYGGSDSPAF